MYILLSLTTQFHLHHIINVAESFWVSLSAFNASHLVCGINGIDKLNAESEWSGRGDEKPREELQTPLNTEFYIKRPLNI